MAATNSVSPSAWTHAAGESEQARPIVSLRHSSAAQPTEAGDRTAEKGAIGRMMASWEDR